MDDAAAAPSDNRRLTARVVVSATIRTMASLADLHRGDMIEMLVFVTIWMANSEHANESGRHAALNDIMPDSQRRPVSAGELCEMLRMPSDIVERYVEKLIADGQVEIRSGGLVVPSAVFTEERQMESANELYARVMGLVAALRGAGFGLGDPA